MSAANVSATSGISSTTSTFTASTLLRPVYMTGKLVAPKRFLDLADSTNCGKQPSIRRSLPFIHPRRRTKLPSFIKKVGCYNAARNLVTGSGRGINDRPVGQLRILQG